MTAHDSMHEPDKSLAASAASAAPDASDPGGDFDVAVIGMSGRFPGADGIDEFWANIRDGRECITHSTRDELRASGHPPEIADDPHLVPATGRLRDVQHFDAAFFGFSPREAEALEPSHRIFLECAWEAMEDAGYDPSRAGGAVAVYAGAAGHGYTELNVRGSAAATEGMTGLQLSMAGGADFLATRTAYKLDLRGPAVTVQTGCSTSLVAVHLAAQSLLRGECDLALAGGACVHIPDSGYIWSPGGPASPDGHCRAFDAASAGMVGGNGAGVVVLKRLADALRDGDAIRAVVRGSAVNNDGAGKVAYTAPSVDGQAAVIAEALALAGVDPATVGLVETHGSGTELGDPIEVAALTRAFRATVEQGEGWCALGAVKTAIGHLDAAAGIAGFIKTVLSLEHARIPPVVNFTAPNPRVPFAGSPFFVPDAPREWETDGHPRRAGVSSFGIGGTNAHVVLEEAPAAVPSGASRPWQLLALSARTAAAADAAVARLADHFQSHPHLPLADVAFTLREGRRALPHRRIAVVREGEDTAAVLRGPGRVASGVAEAGSLSVAFLFPGLGDHYPQMARGLYEAEPVFRAEVDRCAEILVPLLGLDLRDVLFPGEAPSDAAPEASGFDLRRILRPDAPDPAAERLNRTELAQPAVFVVSWALAKLWMSWGIAPEAVIGHSLGEYAAACVAGVLSLEDALALVAGRAALIGRLPGGAMLAVSAAPDALHPHLPQDVAIATVNAPELCVAAGPEAGIAALERRLGEMGITARRLATTHAFHSPMMAPAADALARLAASVRLRPPRIPIISNVTGTWLTDAEATDPAYWTRHLLGTVRFAEGAGALLSEPGHVLLEVGPGQTLSTFVRQRADGGEAAPAAVVPSLRYAYDRRPDQAVLLDALGRLWMAGVAPDWSAFRGGERRRRVHLPTYPWDRQRYWIDWMWDKKDNRRETGEGKRADPAEWTYVPTWTRTPAASPDETVSRILLVTDGGAMGDEFAAALSGDGRQVVIVHLGAAFARDGDEWTLRPGSRDDFRALAAAEGDRKPQLVVDLSNDPISFLLLASALAHAGVDTRVVAVTRGAQEVAGDEEIDPRAAAVAAACRAAALEHPALPCRAVDVTGDSSAARRLADEVLAVADEPVAALRGRHRWARGFRAVRAERPAAAVREGGVYVFAGGLEGRGAALAAALAETPGVRIAVVDARLPVSGEMHLFLEMLSPGNPAHAAASAVKALADAGVEVVTDRADPVHELDAAFRRVEERWGRVDGVFHALGMDALAAPAAVDEVQPAGWALEMDRVDAQLAALETAIAGRALDFVLVESSLAGVVGAVGLARVAMANARVDAWAQRAARTGAPVTSIAWDRAAAPAASTDAADALWIAPHEVAPALRRVLALAGEPNVLVSTGALEPRIRRGARPAEAPARRYARPGDLSTAYQPPESDTEARIAEVWQTLLGVDRVGVHDDFFALGGHSLLATQIIARLKDMFELELPLKVIFEAPTIAKMSLLVEEAILAEIEALSEDEVNELVAG
ncbi:polyketide synthase [Longimicrobium sp.]|uniref:type I polyketide synthase n=1 Tax=Longimicrobium sp. TaxID=2029185 RepID=UPI002CF57AE2|nr:polyketide synthase [Longimicrobium sp.]HSU17609.1 beta-ketoacyl synthase N-terminal-like domain-containing protein [Longimicrobium sp.]